MDTRTAMEYALLNKQSIEQFQDYLLPYVRKRIKEDTIFFYGAAMEDTLVGVTAFEIGETSELLSIAITESCQGKEVGSFLIEGIVDTIQPLGVHKLCAVLAGTDEELAGFGQFLWRNGFRVASEISSGVISLQEAKAFGGNLSGPVLALSKTEDGMRRRLFNFLIQNGLYHNFMPKKLSEETSFLYLHQNEVKGCLLTGWERGEFLLGLIYVAEDNPDRLALFRMLHVMFNRMESDYPKDTRIRMIIQNEVMGKILEKLYGSQMKREVIREYSRSLLPLGEDQIKSNWTQESREEASRWDREHAMEGSVASQPQFEIITNSAFVCGDCRFRLTDTGVLRCHKFDIKPTKVLSGRDCPKYKKESETSKK